MRSLDALAASHRGSTPVRASDVAGLSPEAADIARRFHVRLDELGWTTVQQFDWQLLEWRRRAPTPSAPIASLLVLGFDGLHWDLWPLLNAAVRSAAQADVILSQPRYKAEGIDQLWVGSWEEHFGAAQPLDAADTPRPFAPLAEKMENPEGAFAAGAARADILIGRNLREQAGAVVARVVTWLAEGRVTRLGILVPGPGALGREISARLLDQGIVHHDAPGHAGPPDAETDGWQAWIALQREQRLGPLLALLDCTAADPASAAADEQRNETAAFRDALERAYGEVMTDDLAVVGARLAAGTGTHSKAATGRLADIALLPPAATLATFVADTHAACERFAWTVPAAALAEQFAAIRELGNTKVARSLFLDWLASVTTVVARVRPAGASNPFAPVQLLPYGQAEGQPWSHLLLAGLNEGSWPPSFDQPGFIGETEIAALNKRAVTTGSQGEGHAAVRADCALVIGPVERRALARRQFYNLVESPAIALAVTAALEDDEGARGVGPGEYLSHLHFAQQGAPLTEVVSAQIQAATCRWIAAGGPAAPACADGGLSAVAATRIAFEARRRLAPFGEYEFALNGPPAAPLTIACKKWETALSSPAVVWLESVLAVEEQTDFLADDRWPLAIGTWVHAWLRTAIGAAAPDRLVRRPDAGTMQQRLAAAAERTRATAERAYQAAHRSLPDWWHAQWARAAWDAGRLAARIGEIEEHAFAQTEWSLPKPTPVRLGDGVTLRLVGRMDLVLANEEIFRAGAPLWLFDFKTGSDKPLTAKNLLGKFAEGGGGLQLALYALGLQAIGAAAVDITLLTPDTEARPQIALADVATLTDFWRGLAQMQDTGCFGLRGELRPEHGHSRAMPLATLPVPEDLLDEKWALTHPLLTGGET